MNETTEVKINRISIVMPDFSAGGAERVGINLANAWFRQGYDVDFVVMERRGPLAKYIDPSIPICEMDAKRIRSVPLKLAKYLRTRSPDICVVNMWPLTTVGVLAAKIARVKTAVFCCEHTNLQKQIEKDLPISLPIARALARLTFRAATGVIAVSDGVAADLIANFSSPTHRTHSVCNPIVGPISNVESTVGEADPWELHFSANATSKRLLCIGNLKREKNHAFLIEVVSRLSASTDVQLAILGEGPERPKLERLIERLGLTERVCLAGYVADVAAWLKSADLCVFSSEYEGFGNVLVEALHFGLPIVSTDCPHGPSEILANGKFGVLVPVGDVSRMVDGIKCALETEWDVTSLKARAQDFSIEKQAAEYLRIFRTSLES
jgi:glycosyltransferase involved in cell wall biosynthesis